MSRLALLLLLCFIVGCLVDAKTFTRKLKSRRLTANEIIKRNANLPSTTGKLFQIGFPYEYIFDIITVGTPGEDFEISVETGYNQLWLLDPSYPGLDPNWNEVYDPSNSNTSVTTGNYGYGYSGVNSLSGYSFTDEVKYLFSAVNQSFNTISEIWTVSGYNPKLEFSGILGLAWDTAEAGKSSNESSSPIINILDNLEVPRIYTIWQYREADGGFSETAIHYGSSDFGLCADDLQYFPIVGYSKYMGLNFKVGGFSFGDYSKRSDDWTGQLDTGASIVYFSSVLHDKIYRVINPTFNDTLQLYTTDCSQANTLPDWVFTIGGRDWNLPASQYIVDIELGNGQCVAAFSTFDGFTPQFVFGQPMLRQYCSVYDVDNNQVGLSTAVQFGSATTATPVTDDS